MIITKPDAKVVALCHIGGGHGTEDCARDLTLFRDVHRNCPPAVMQFIRGQGGRGRQQLFPLRSGRLRCDGRNVACLPVCIGAQSAGLAVQEARPGVQGVRPGYVATSRGSQFAAGPKGVERPPGLVSSACRALIALAGARRERQRSGDGTHDGQQLAVNTSVLLAPADSTVKRGCDFTGCIVDVRGGKLR